MDGDKVEVNGVHGICPFREREDLLVHNSHDHDCLEVLPIRIELNPETRPLVFCYPGLDELRQLVDATDQSMLDPVWEVNFDSMINLCIADYTPGDGSLPDPRDPELQQLAASLKRALGRLAELGIK